MAINNGKLLSGAAPVVAYDQLANTRYQFLTLGQAEPSLGAGNANSILTLGVGNARIWSSSISVTSINSSGNVTAGNVFFGSGIVSGTGNIYANKIFANISGNIDAAGNLNEIQFNTTGDQLGANANFTYDFANNVFTVNNGNVVAGNVVVGNILIPSSGNVTLGNVNINNLANPVANSDAATKFYVDSVAGNLLPIISNQTISPDGSSSTFNLNQSTTAVGVLVTINGVTQTPNVSYTVASNNISFSQTPLTGDIIQVRYLSGTTTGSGGGTNYANANVVAYAESGWGGNIIPQGNLVYNLGNSTNRWNDLYLSGNTIYLDSATIGATGTDVTFSGNVTGVYVKGNGSELTNLPAPAVAQDITSVGDMSIMLYDGTIKYNNYATVEPATGDIKSAGKISAVGNISGGNLIATGNIVLTGSLVGSGASPAPSLSGFSSVSAATLSASGNVTVGGNLSVTGSIIGNVVTRFESTWTVPTGNSNQSFTVTPNETYYMWVDCNIPNGILAWNATATVTNTNVPVVGAQYAWVYNGGGTPIDFTSIPNQFIGTANTIVRSSVAPSSTTNVFTFGINNTSGTSQIVNYGWIKIS
jgi:hypothetical protein